MRALPVMARDTEIDKLRELGMGCPEKFEELLHFVGMAIAIVLCEKGIGVTDLVTYVFLKSHFHQIDDEAMWQTGDTIRAFPCGGTRTAGRHDQTLHPPRIVLRQTERNPPAHGVTQKMRRGQF